MIHLITETAETMNIPHTGLQNGLFTNFKGKHLIGGVGRGIKNEIHEIFSWINNFEKVF